MVIQMHVNNCSMSENRRLALVAEDRIGSSVWQQGLSLLRCQQQNRLSEPAFRF
jgi:hypothetical protein